MKSIKLITLASVVSLAMILSSCGIDNFVYLYPVTQLLNNPSAVDPSLNYFSFRTSDKNNHDNDSGDYFKGFEIYYRIYNSESIRSSDASDIYTYNYNNPTTSFNYLVNIKKYSRMTYAGRTTEIPLISGADHDRDVKIRLTDYLGSSNPAEFSIDSSGNLGDPRRTLNEGTSFVSFDYYDNNNQININNSDNDVQYSSSSSTDEWYVQAYVVAYGYDESFKAYYSEIFCLNYATIKKSS